LISLVAAAIAMSSQKLSPVDTTTVTVEEDSPQWSCREMGNRVCAPDYAEGVEPGFYGDPDEPIRSEWFGR